MVDINSPIVLRRAYALAAKIETEVLGFVRGMKQEDVIRVLDEVNEDGEDRVIAGIPINMKRMVGSGSFILSSPEWRLECHPNYKLEYDYMVRHDATPERSMCYRAMLSGDQEAFDRDFTVLLNV